MRIAFATFWLGLCCAGPAIANPPLGLWLTEPDKKGQVAHVEVTRCDAALCGEIVRTLDPQGQPIAHPNIGKRVFWDMKATGEGTYQGRAYVPAHDREYRGRLTHEGDRLEVGGCVGPICMSQEWSRVQ